MAGGRAGGEVVALSYARDPQLFNLVAKSFHFAGGGDCNGLVPRHDADHGDGAVCQWVEDDGGETGRRRNGIPAFGLSRNGKRRSARNFMLSLEKSLAKR